MRQNRQQTPSTIVDNALEAGLRSPEPDIVENALEGLQGKKFEIQRARAVLGPLVDIATGEIGLEDTSDMEPLFAIAGEVLARIGDDAILALTAESLGADRSRAEMALTAIGVAQDLRLMYGSRDYPLSDQVRADLLTGMRRIVFDDTKSGTKLFELAANIIKTEDAQK